MQLKLPQELYEAISEVKGKSSHQSFIIDTLRNIFSTQAHGDRNGSEEREEVKE